MSWSPDHRYIAFTYGPTLKESGRALQGSPELPGNPAPGWNICVADATGTNRWVAVTSDGASCKEADWVPVRKETHK